MITQHSQQFELLKLGTILNAFLTITNNTLICNLMRRKSNYFLRLNITLINLFIVLRHITITTIVMKFYVDDVRIYQSLPQITTKSNGKLSQKS